MGQRIPSKGIQQGYNFDNGAFKDTDYVRCSRCGFINNLERDLRSHPGGYEGWGTSFPTVTNVVTITPTLNTSTLKITYAVVFSQSES